MPREQFLNHGQDLWRRGGTSGTRGEASPTVRRTILPPPARQVEAARPAPPTPHPLGPAPSLTAGGTGSATGVSRYLLRSHGERCGCGRGLDSARLEAAAAAPRLRSSPHALSPPRSAASRWHSPLGVNALTAAASWLMHQLRRPEEEAAGCGRQGRAHGSLRSHGVHPQFRRPNGAGQGAGGRPSRGQPLGFNGRGSRPLSPRAGRCGRGPQAARCRSREGSLRASGATSLSPKPAPIRARGFLTVLLLWEAPWIPSHPGCLNLGCTGLGVVSNGGLSKQ